MKNRLNWGLGILSLLVLAAGAVVWDANRRAWKAFEAHEARVAALIAQLRTRHKAAPVHVPDPRGATPLSFRRVNERIQMRESGLFFPYESGWAANSNLSFFLYQFRDDLLIQTTQESVLKGLGAAHDLCRGGDPEILQTQLAMESHALKGWREALEGHLLTAREARDMIAGLDALMAARPRVEDVILGVHLMHCGSIFHVLRKRQDPIGYLFSQEPGARAFYSWKIMLVQMLNERAEEYQHLATLPDGTGQERYQAAFALENNFRRKYAIPQWHEASAADLIRDDALLLDRWILARTATAIAGHQTEHGRSPASLQELLPAWLPELPRSAYSGAPLDYADGTLRSPAWKVTDADDPWIVKRR